MRDQPWLKGPNSLIITKTEVYARIWAAWLPEGAGDWPQGCGEVFSHPVFLNNHREMSEILVSGF